MGGQSSSNYNDNDSDSSNDNNDNYSSNNNSYNNNNQNNQNSNNNNSQQNNLKENHNSTTKEDNKNSNLENGRSYGGEARIGLCGCYAEKTSHGDYNIGIDYSKSIDKGIHSFGSGGYLELTYNKDDGVSFGAGFSVERSSSLKFKGKPVQAGIYESDYSSEDKIRKHLCC